MGAEQSMWHVNDVVAYDAMREISCSVQARLVDRIRGGNEDARSDLIEVRQATLHLDGYDRVNVEAYTQQLKLRDAELSRTASSAS